MIKPLSLLVILTAFIPLAQAQHAQDTSALINKALDEQTKLDFSKPRPLPETMDEITKATGVALEAHPSVWDLLPWGRDTTVGIRIDNMTLRDALNVVTRRLGLVPVLREEFVEIVPMPGLRRLGQRASIQEINALNLLASVTLNLNTTTPTIRQLLDAVDAKLEADKTVNVAIENRIGDAIPLDRTVFVPKNATLMEALESLTKETRATWFPWGRNVVVLTKEDRTRQLLGKSMTIPLGQGGMDVLKALMEVSRATGVPFEFQPGVIQAVPLDARTIRGVIENASAQQILQQISASTGLTYTIQNDKVYVSTVTQGAAGPRDPIIAMLQLDDGMQVMIPTSQVPPEVREYLRHKIQEHLKKVREMMEDEGFKPTTQPGTATEDRDL
jgi:hypothetical protein